MKEVKYTKATNFRIFDI